MKDFVLQSKQFLFINFFLYLLLKVSIFFYSDKSVFFSNDSIVYLSLSEHLINFGLLDYIKSTDESTFFRTPFYPFFLYILNNNIFLTVISQSFIMIFVCYIFLEILKFFNLKNNLAVTIILFTPNFFYHSSIILTETVFLFLFLLSILNLLHFIKTKKIKFFLFCIVWVMISSLVRPIADVFIYLYLGFLFYFYLSDKTKNIKKKLLIILLSIIIISPNLLWKTRNFLLFDDFKLSYVNKNSIIHYYAGVIYNSSDIYQFERDYLSQSNQNFNTSLEKTNYMYPIAIDYILKNKFKLLKNNIIGTLKFFFTPGEDLYFKIYSKLENESDAFDKAQRHNLSEIFDKFYELNFYDFFKNYIFALFFILVYLIFYILSFLGLLKFERHKLKFIIPILIIMALFIPPSSFYYSNYRFRITFEILIIIFYFNFFKHYYLPKR